MNTNRERKVYEELGVRPLINASSNMTILGGSRLSPGVQAAMEAANRYYVDMHELVKQTGRIIAERLGAESAFITTGCSAAIALAAAACMSGSDPEKIKQLPNTTGMKDEIIIQKAQRYKYDRSLTLFGGNLVEVGTESGTTIEALNAAVTQQTAAIYFVDIEPYGARALPLKVVFDVARERRIPLIVDAASAVYPLERMRSYNEMGAELVCYGAKYFGALNSTGVLSGRRELVKAAFLHSFSSFESGTYQGLGRPLKLDRQEIVAVVAALREWFTMDHEIRIAEQERQGQIVQLALTDLPHVRAEWVFDSKTTYSNVHISLDESALGKTAADVKKALLEGTPKIWVGGNDNHIEVRVSQLFEGEAQIIADRLRELLEVGAVT